IGILVLPMNTTPDSYALAMASRSPVVRGAGVTPPSGDSRMLRALHGSNLAGSAQSAGVYGHPSWTICADGFQLPTLALTSRNSAGVMCPSVSACRPYWTPTLSHVERA